MFCKKKKYVKSKQRKSITWNFTLNNVEIIKIRKKLYWRENPTLFINFTCKKNIIFKVCNSSIWF